MPKTIRVTSTTFSSDHVAPDGSHRFPAGTVADVPDETASRWIANKFAVEWHGDAASTGGRVSDREAQMSEADIDAQIARLQALKRNAGGAGAAGQEDRLPEDQPLGETPYEQSDSPHPLAQYNLTEQQTADLERAGFGRPDQIRRAKDEDLLAVPGVGVATLRKLRGEE